MPGYKQLRITQPDALDDGQWGVTHATTAASRTPLWLVSGLGCRGRRLSRGSENPDTLHLLLFGLLQEHNIRIGVAADQTQLAAIE
jgi:hypothetical protein